MLYVIFNACFYQVIRQDKFKHMCCSGNPMLYIAADMIECWIHKDIFFYPSCLFQLLRWNKKNHPSFLPWRFPFWEGMAFDFFSSNFTQSCCGFFICIFRPSFPLLKASRGFCFLSRFTCFPWKRSVSDFLTFFEGVDASSLAIAITF